MTATFGDALGDTIICPMGCSFRMRSINEGQNRK
jgi:hypothetical protein